jgi:hypothetical protein
MPIAVPIASPEQRTVETRAGAVIVPPGTTGTFVASQKADQSPPDAPLVR